jgi:hypothetical protein
VGRWVKIVAAAKPAIAKKRVMPSFPQALCQSARKENRAFCVKFQQTGKSCREFTFRHG